MAALDYTVLGVYLSCIMGIGVFFARRQKSDTEFFLAGRSVHWLPLGLSVMVTLFSVMNYRAFSFEVAAHGLYVMLVLPVFALVSIPVTRIVMPFFHDMRLTSAHEYLERRFDRRVKWFASLLFMAWRVLWMATSVYAVAGLLHAVSGFPVAWVIVVVGGVSIAYTTAGGMRAVIWTDVAQFAVIVTSVVLAAAVSTARVPGGLAGVFRSAASDGLLKPFYPFDPGMLSPDPRVRITLWSALIGAFVAFLARYGADQAVLQRYFSTRSLDDARRGFRMNYLSAIAVLVCLALLGLAMAAYSRASGACADVPSPLACFAALLGGFPAGVRGLVVAGLLAAAMSSIDSGLHSCATAFVKDFIKSSQGHGTDEGGRAGVLAGRGAMLVFGVATVALAFLVGRLGTVFEIANKVVNGVGGPLLAVFLLGMFSRRANAAGVLAGGIIGVAWSAFVVLGVRDLALHYYAVANFAGTLALCYVLSLLAARVGARGSAAATKWTWWERMRPGIKPV